MPCITLHALLNHNSSNRFLFPWIWVIKWNRFFKLRNPHSFSYEKFEQKMGARPWNQFSNLVLFDLLNLPKDNLQDFRVLTFLARNFQLYSCLPHKVRIENCARYSTVQWVIKPWLSRNDYTIYPLVRHCKDYEFSMWICLATAQNSPYDLDHCSDSIVKLWDLWIGKYARNYIRASLGRSVSAIHGSHL